jgi:fumarylacetoacetate (FAA) hydrolase family protein
MALLLFPRNGALFDVTHTTAPIIRDMLECPDAADYVRRLSGGKPGPLSGKTPWSAQSDFQTVKVCGGTFAGSMTEQVNGEKVAGRDADD